MSTIRSGSLKETGRRLEAGGWAVSWPGVPWTLLLCVSRDISELRLFSPRALVDAVGQMSCGLAH